MTVPVPFLHWETKPLLAAEEVLRAALQSSDASERVIAAKCLGLIAGYHARWITAPYRIEAVESVVTSDLFNPRTQAKSRTFTLAGMIDVIAREIGTDRRVIFDHKTTSEDITDPNAPYWRQLVIEGQPTHYLLLEWLNGRKADYAIWDVVRKPQTRPAKIVGKKERADILYGRKYFGLELSIETLDEFRATEAETPEMYAARLTHDCSSDRPHWYFQRRQIPRLDAEILEYAQELWDHSQDVILSRRYERYPRNSGACLLYKSPCKFLGVCSGHDTVESANWTRAAWPHPELPVLETAGRDVLTNSRIRCWQTCRRKHHLQFELGVQRIDEEEREALRFGTLWHQAQEQYFLTLKSIQEKQ